MGDYRLFLDESGQREFGRKTTNYFVMAGVACERHLQLRLEHELAGLKRACFGHCDVEVKSNWLRIPAERTTRYLDKYGISNEKLEAFCYALYDRVLAAPITLLAGVVDKTQLTATYTRPHNPSAVVYNVVLQRYQKLLCRLRACPISPGR
jgi:hypothetical protein